MPRYRYKVVCYTEINASNETEAEEKLEEEYKNVEDVVEYDLRCVYEDEPDWDAIMDEMRLA